MPENSNPISSIGESSLIERLKSIYPAVSDADLILGIGDDCAAVRLDADRILLATTDAQIENVHFRRDWITPHQLGSRAAAVNLSDIAAMGGCPKYALVSLALPGDLPVSYYDDLNRGISDQLARFSAHIIGGNLSRGDHISINITLLGECHPSRLIRRSTARPGDLICVTGNLGSSAAGLELLKRFGNDYPHEFAPLVTKHLAPEPRVSLGQALAATGHVTAMTDVSDGLATDLLHICESSGVGAEINPAKIPAHPSLKSAAELLKLEPLELQLGSGEEYELLFTWNPATPLSVSLSEGAGAGIDMAAIGVITDQVRQLRLINGKSISGKQLLGWSHFK